MSKRRGRTTTVVVPTDGGTSPNLYNPRITAEVRVFAPPHTPRSKVIETLNEAYREAMADVLNDYYEER